MSWRKLSLFGRRQRAYILLLMLLIGKWCVCVFVSMHVCVGIDCFDPNTTTSFMYHFIQSFCDELMLQSAAKSWRKKPSLFRRIPSYKVRRRLKGWCVYVRRISVSLDATVPSNKQPCTLRERGLIHSANRAILIIDC